MGANALIVVDVQNDFLPGGTLAINEGHRIIPGINQLVTLPFNVIVATKDWHPPNHGSFAANQGKLVGETIYLNGIKQILWPTHCVQGTKGAEFAPELDAAHFHKVFYKGVDPKIDSYSCFFDNGHKQTTGLGDYLKSKNVTKVYFAGLATDYCVKYSVFDAVQLGFEAYIVNDVCCGIDVHADDCSHALEEMRQAGARVINSLELKAMFASNLV
ncbi:MAG: bifunctional nicotinamidase/pyrazinamidase [Parachlamydiales bacterium]|jgi:nicotinamidase/pyrazinamidase